VAVVGKTGAPTLVGTSGSSQPTASAPTLKVEEIKVIRTACQKQLAEEPLQWFRF
jgi:hypothetical protein